MLRLVIGAVLALLAGFSSLQAQQLFFCNEVSSDGLPIVQSDKWVIDSDGGAIYLLYKHFSFIDGKKLLFRIRKYSDGGEYLPYDEKLVSVKPGVDFYVLDYRFTETGKYEVAVGVGNVEYTSKRLEIGDKYAGKLNTYYYASSKIIACERVEGGAVVNPSTQFEMKLREAYVSFQITNGGKPIEADKLVVDIFRKGPSSQSHDYLVETISFDIEKRWNKPYFKYVFTWPGEYRLNVFTEQDVWINSCFISIIH